MNLQQFSMPLLNGVEQPLAEYQGMVGVNSEYCQPVRIHAPIPGAGATLSTTQR